MMIQVPHVHHSVKLVHYASSHFFFVKSRSFLAIPVLICLLTLPTQSLALEPYGSCNRAQAKDQVGSCSIGVARVPTMSCPFVRGATSSAPVVIQPTACVNTIKQRGEAPLNTIVCGAAPVLLPSRKICASEAPPRNLAPYLPADDCPKAPMVLQEPYRLDQRFCR
jgi:hypothetical protein